MCFIVDLWSSPTHLSICKVLLFETFETKGICIFIDAESLNDSEGVDVDDLQEFR